MTCAVPSCDRQRMKKFDLCAWHRRRQREGRPLDARKGTGGHNKKYTDDMTCEFETCDRKPVTNNKCTSHDFQMRKHGMMWEIGTPRPGRVYKQTEGRWNHYMGSVYSETRTCETCGETKNWKKFVMGMDTTVALCRDCHRTNLSKRVDVNPVNGVGQGRRKQKRSNMEELMDFLNNRTN